MPYDRGNSPVIPVVQYMQLDLSGHTFLKRFKKGTQFCSQEGGGGKLDMITILRFRPSY